MQIGDWQFVAAGVKSEKVGQKELGQDSTFAVAAELLTGW